MNLIGRFWANREPILTASIVFLICVFFYQKATWWPRWALLSGLLSVFMGYQISKKTNWLCGLVFSYTLINGLLVSVGRVNQYAGEDVLLRLNIYYGVFYASVMLILICFWASHYGVKAHRFIGWVFGGLCLADSIFVIIQIQHPALYRGGLLNYAGMNGCFIAMTIPLMWKTLYDLGCKYWVLIGSTVFPIFAIILSGASMPYGVLAAVLVVTAFKLMKPIPFVLSVAIGLGGLTVVGLKTQQKEFFNDSMRIEIMKRNWRWMKSGELWREGTKEKPEHWAKYKSFWRPWVGTGNGSYLTLGPIVMSQPGQHTHLVTWAHSDFWQTLVELGYVGVGLYGIMFLWAIVRLWGRFYHLTAIAGWLACATLNYPVHLVPTALFGAYLLREAFGSDSVGVPGKTGQ